MGSIPIPSTTLCLTLNAQWKIALTVAKDLNANVINLGLKIVVRSVVLAAAGKDGVPAVECFPVMAAAMAAGERANVRKSL